MILAIKPVSVVSILTGFLFHCNPLTPLACEADEWQAAALLFRTIGQRTSGYVGVPLRKKDRPRAAPNPGGHRKT
jgi:hypothetical protein